MPYVQPSLWDVIDFQKGNLLLINLKFDEAEKYFIEALKSPLGDAQLIEKSLETCIFWKEKLSDSINPIIDKNLLQVFKDFHFSKRLATFKKALLKHLALPIISAGNNKNPALLFDLLLVNSEYDLALSLIENLLKSEPQNYSLYYYLGQVFCRIRDFIKAHECYAVAFLYDPSPDFMSRIESEKIHRLVTTHGVNETYIYGVLNGVFAAIKLSQGFKSLNEIHKKAIQFYNFYLLAEKASLNHDRKTEINYRKEMMNTDVGIFKAYMNKKEK